jgi:hypothetical protein
MGKGREGKGRGEGDWACGFKAKLAGRDGDEHGASMGRARGEHGTSTGRARDKHGWGSGSVCATCLCVIHVSAQSGSKHAGARQAPPKRVLTFAEVVQGGGWQGRGNNNRASQAQGHTTRNSAPQC